MNKFEVAKKKNRVALTIIVIIIVLVLSLIVSILFINAPMNSSSNEIQTITINEGESLSDISEDLETREVVRSATGFKIIAKLMNSETDFKAGNYDLSPSMSCYEIVTIISGGETSDAMFTVVEGNSIEQIASQLSKDNFASYNEVMNEVKNGKFEYEFMSMLPEGEKRLEGVLYPDTYKIPKGSSAHQIIDKMLKEFNDNIYKQYKDKTVKSKYNFYDVLKVASIVEKEAGVDGDRAKVASVIYNRLEKGMNLQMCSTVSYVLKNDKAILTEAETQTDSPYNTYIHEGLPPTPIGNPGLKSIGAAFNPAESNYLYFVLSEKLDGTSNFSSDYDTFLKDRENYSKAYEEKNDKGNK